MTDPNGRICAPDFAPWQIDITHPLDNNGYTRAAQYSAIGTDSVDAYGWIEFSAEVANYWGSPPLYFPVNMDNKFYLRFAVPVTTSLNLLGMLDLQFDGSDEYWDPNEPNEPWSIRYGRVESVDFEARVHLARLAVGPVFDRRLSIHQDYWQGAPALLELPLTVAHELPPGIYDLTIQTSAAVMLFSDYGEPAMTVGEATYVVTADFVPAAPPAADESDLDGDGDSDLADLARFQRTFTGPLLQ